MLYTYKIDLDSDGTIDIVASRNWRECSARGMANWKAYRKMGSRRSV
ncbi:MAG: hypothetical protein IPL42_03145 [Saprospiraceae bacterium]|nr:hypothetical protein [Saprospiraceae bacterium]